MSRFRPASDADLPPADQPVNAPCLCGHPRSAHALDRPPWPCLEDGCWCYQHGLRVRPWWIGSVEPLYLDLPTDVMPLLLKAAMHRRDMHVESKSIVDKENELANELIGVAVEWAVCHMLGVPPEPVLRRLEKNKGDGHAYDVVLPKTGRLCEVKSTAHGKHLLDFYGGRPPLSKPTPWDVAVLGKWATKRDRVAILGYATRACYHRFRTVRAWKRPVWALEQCALAPMAELLADEGIDATPYTWASVRARDVAERGLTDAEAE